MSTKNHSLRQRPDKLSDIKDDAPSSSTSSSKSSSSSSKEKKAELLVNSKSKWRSSWTRAWTTLVMLAVFIMLFSMGHIPLFGLLFFCQVMMFKEVKRISNVLSTQKALPSFRPLHWYWFATAIFFAYGRVLDYNFGISTPYHLLISFLLYVFGVVLFVFSLEKGYYKFQFEMFGWVQLTLLLVVIQSTFIVINMCQGLIWFILPALLIISNDTFAYIFGFFWGRTPLITISPKKTWEGFLGAAATTLLVGYYLPVVLSEFQLLICPKHDLTFQHPHCDKPPAFIPTIYQLPNSIISALQLLGTDISQITVLPIQLHGLIFAIFASIIAPFGGFFASGLKRAFGIKDFGDSIPGHGGVTDRMDCQILMGLFAFVYYTTFVNTESNINLASLEHHFAHLSNQDQLQFYDFIREQLTGKGLLN